MEQTTPLQYLLSNSLLVALNEDMSIPFVTVERTVMSFYGFSEELDEAAGIAVWRDIKSGDRAFITSRNEELTEDDLIQLAQSFECPVMDLMNDKAIAQDLIKDLGLHVSPVLFRNGSLTGAWRAERISSYAPFDNEVNGIITGVNQPVATESTNLLHAIFATACRVMGLGKLAYIHFPNGAEGSATVIASDLSMSSQFESEIGTSIFRAPVLDQYITSRLTDEVKTEAIANARAECRAVITTAEPEA
ncbi:hypothetical protein ACSI5N_25670 (plasmid) [Raoultella ornithinolytica]|uniref:hypothetical protein n=1 Tax=Raoultella ornithinolytica TaxID=54291 RepID=UPI00292A77A1|nr:hypothetical protein [Raoultella ornithinolytica]MDV1095016.1 hypothetical protein [Raoultella ornithinolytica]MDV1124012.1 hypothetical protein [Raoultella ornithinolytica]MDV1894294.1 hypothetical protein [Raoultella ornithinolytica]